MTCRNLWIRLAETPNARQEDTGTRTKDLATDPHDEAGGFQRRDDRGTTLVCWMIRWLPTPKSLPRRCGTVTRHLEQRTQPGSNFFRLPPLPLTVVHLALHSFAPDPAAEPSSLHPQHIKGACSKVTETRVMRSLRAVVRIWAEGNIPGSVVSVASASLRRVAVGDTLRRLTRKALLAMVAEDMARYLRPTQPGFRTKTRLCCQCPRHQTMAPKTGRRRKTVLVGRVLSTRLTVPVFFPGNPTRSSPAWPGTVIRVTRIMDSSFVLFGHRGSRAKDGCNKATL